MKHIYTFITAFFILVASAQAQVTIYHENLSSSEVGLSSSPANEWGISNLTPSNNLQASGGNNVRTSTSTLNGARERTLILNNQISTIGYKSLKLSWRAYRTQNWRQGQTIYTSHPNTGNPSKIDNNKPVVLEYSLNGRDFTAINFTQNTNTFARWYNANGGVDIALPAALENKVNIILRWRIVVDNTNNDYFAMDDITITGMPEEGLSTLDWSKYARNENPFAVGKSYTVDGKTVKFTRVSASGVELSIAKVTDSLFQAGAPSLTLVQKKATSTAGSTIGVKFNEPVSDLTFTLFDIDQASGQFQDRIVITGKGSNGQTVVAQRNKVITTSKNQFTTSNNVLLGISGDDVTASSPDGNVRFTFNVEVVEVNLTYFNAATGTLTADGQQGIGIHNLSWRYEQPIISLPVELVSFKAQANANGVNLTWRTASEQGNKGFEVQVSTDGKHFRKIGFVESKVGTTSLMQNYSFRDAEAASGTNYYRLKQIDFDGTSEFSKTIAANITLASSSAVYPTLATSDVTVRLARSDEQVTILVADIAGKQLAVLQNPSDRQVVVPVQHLQSGIYFVTVITGANKEVFRFVKQ